MTVFAPAKTSSSLCAGIVPLLVSRTQRQCTAFARQVDKDALFACNFGFHRLEQKGNRGAAHKHKEWIMTSHNLLPVIAIFWIVTNFSGFAFTLRRHRA